MRPGGKSNGESPFFETPNLSFEERVGNVAIGTMTSGTRRAGHVAGQVERQRASRWSTTSSQAHERRAHEMGT